MLTQNVHRMWANTRPRLTSSLPAPFSMGSCPSSVASCIFPPSRGDTPGVLQEVAALVPVFPCGQVTPSAAGPDTDSGERQPGRSRMINATSHTRILRLLLALHTSSARIFSQIVSRFWPFHHQLHHLQCDDDAVVVISITAVYPRAWTRRRLSIEDIKTHAPVCPRDAGSKTSKHISKKATRVDTRQRRRPTCLCR